MRLSRTVGYALRATLYLAGSEDDRPVPCSRLAAEGNMPGRFLLQILRNLVAHGVLKSTRGVEGGYSLQRKPDEISLLEVIEAVDGPMVSELTMVNGLPGESHALLQEAVGRVTDLTRGELDSIKLAQLLPRRGE